VPIFMCRWPNGDCSVVQATNKGNAIELLDEVGNAEGCPLTALKENFMVHFKLTDDGELELELFGELLDGEIMEFGYPILCEAGNRASGFSDDSEKARKIMREAAIRERERVTERKPKEPKTLLGSKMKAAMDAPTRKVDRIVESETKKSLEKFKGKGKTH
jgi:hypothetical protein